MVSFQRSSGACHLWRSVNRGSNARQQRDNRRVCRREKAHIENQRVCSYVVGGSRFHLFLEKVNRGKRKWSKRSQTVKNEEEKKLKVPESEYIGEVILGLSSFDFDEHRRQVTKRKKGPRRRIASKWDALAD